MLRNKQSQPPQGAEPLDEAEQDEIVEDLDAKAAALAAWARQVTGLMCAAGAVAFAVAFLGAALAPARAAAPGEATIAYPFALQQLMALHVSRGRMLLANLATAAVLAGAALRCSGAPAAVWKSTKRCLLDARLSTMLPRRASKRAMCP